MIETEPIDVSAMVCQCNPQRKHSISQMDLSIRHQSGGIIGDYITGGKFSLGECTCQLGDKSGPKFDIGSIDIHLTGSLGSATTHTSHRGWSWIYERDVDVDKEALRKVVSEINKIEAQSGRQPATQLHLISLPR